MILTRDVKWNVFDGEITTKKPINFDLTEGTGHKTTIWENSRNNKENDNKLDLREKELPPPVHEYKCDEIEDD